MGTGHKGSPGSGYIWGLGFRGFWIYSVYIWVIMEKRTETIGIMGYIGAICWGYIGIWGNRMETAI